MHLFNVRRVAWDIGSNIQPQTVQSAPQSAPQASASQNSGVDIDAIAAMIVAELKKVM